MMSFLKQPLLHFFTIGCLLFIWQWWQQAHEIVELPGLDRDTLTRLQDDFVRQTGRMPTPQQVAALQRQELDSRILFEEALRRNFHRDDAVVLQRLLRDADFLGIEGSDEEKIRAALALGVHETDEVIRRRMIQRMERVGRSQGFEPASEDVLRGVYDREKARWQVAERFDFEHVFFSADKPEDPSARAEAALLQLQKGAELSGMGDPFLHGRRFRSQSIRDMTFMFGASFSDAFSVKRPVQGEWSAPLASAYGVHLVRINASQPETTRNFEEVRAKVEQLWRDEQESEALQNFLEQLRERYRVVAAGI